MTPAGVAEICSNVSVFNNDDLMPVVSDRVPVKNQSEKFKPFNFYVQVKTTFNPVITFFGVITQF